MRMCAFVLAIASLTLAGGEPALTAGAAQASKDPERMADAAQQPTTPAVPAYRQATQVAVLAVRGPIDRVTLVSLVRRVERAIRDGANAIVLDIDTPGGELTATLDICHLLKTDAPANTVAWINPNAYSAGTIIALAAREIVVQDNASFGDAAPIIVSPFGLQPLPAAERAKAESPILEEVVDSARRNHYDENLVQAFVSVGVELWLIENVHTGDRVFVDRAEYRDVFGNDPPQQFTSLAVPDVVPGQEHSPIRPLLDRLAPPGEAQSQGAPEPAAQPRQEIPISRPRLTSADADDYRLIRQVVSSDRLLTLRPAEAIHYGLAQRIIRNDEELKAYFGAQTLVRYDQAWSESLARFLMSFPVRAVLIVIFLVALFVELSAPGIGIFGATAAAALLLLIGAPALVGLAQWWGVALILLGIVLIASELFVLTGLGIAGVLGLLSLLVGLVGTFLSGDLSTAQGRFDLWAGIGTTLLALFAAGLLMWLISRQIHSLPLLDRLILKAEVGERTATSEPLRAMEGTGTIALSVGDVGVASTDLRPNGRAMFEGRLVEVQSVEGFIEKGTPLRVISSGRFVTEVEAARD